MEPDKRDTNLLFGILAMKMNFIRQDDLLEAMGIWFLDRQKTLGEILTQRQAISPQDCNLLDAMVLQSQIRQGHVDRPDGQDRPAAPAKPLELVGANGTPDYDLGQLTTEPGPLSDNELTADWSDLRHGNSLERYVLVRPHAKGGIGKVSVALDVQLNREVALKELLEEHRAKRDSRVRFLLEAEVTARLEHPGIVPVYGIGLNASGEPFYVMRFIKGESFKDAVQQFHKGRGASGRGLSSGQSLLGLQQLLRRFVDVCYTIEYAHSRGVIHRDLKPSNVIVGKYGETLVVDWGLAKCVGKDEKRVLADEPTIRPSSHSGSTDTVAGFAVGTPAFMSPEQAEGDTSHVGFASDVYGLGATLYYLLTGQNPISEREITTALRHARRGEFRRPREVDPEIPPALEAICLKAMAQRAEDRFDSPRMLADDLELWLAGEPVSAWPEPARLKLRRWVVRNRTLVSSAAAALLVALVTGGYLAFEFNVTRARRQIEANAQVDSLLTAEVRSVPQIVERLGADRSLVRTRLQSLLRDPAASASRIGPALALLPEDPSQAQVLVDRLTNPEATPGELLVVCDGLMRNKALDPFIEPLTAGLPPAPDPLSDAALRALGSVALARPGWSRWPEFADRLAAKLVQVNPFEIAAWREVFQRVSTILDQPLRRIYSDHSQSQPRALAFSLLLEFASQEDNRQRPEALAGLLPDADPDQFRALLRRLSSPADRERAVAVILPTVGASAHGDLALAQRQARLAPALLEFSRAELVWPMLVHRDDPSLRTELIHIMADYEVDPKVLFERLKLETNQSVRRALILALGGFARERIPPPLRADLKVLLLSWYSSDPDPGIHSATDWALRHGWETAAELSSIDRGLSGSDVPSDRNWFINPSGQSFAIVRGPVSFRMGTVPGSDPYAGGDEWPAERSITRSFAIATREVSVADFRLFLKDNPDLLAIFKFDRPELRMRIPSDDCATGALTWYDAARYCNWLNAREKIPEDQWCYPSSIGPGMTLPKNALERTGYRLPTEAEWEYACRSGATTLWPHGLSEPRLSDYAWTLRDSSRVMHRSGLKRPNNTGLFDALGNASEWCTGTLVNSRNPIQPLPREDTLELLTIPLDQAVEFRGGSFLDPSAEVRSANRNTRRPNERLPYYGLRVARTCPK
jgi:formylglycine-generating enzyme required for sulfatase activity/tRNA A-37 threonylcarbamoyl transferase component Bud32